MTAARPILLDISDLFFRIGRGPVTGIERVTLMHLTHLLADPRPLWGLINHRRGLVILDRAGLAWLALTLTEGHDWGRPAPLTRLRGDMTPDQRAALTAARQRAIAAGTMLRAEAIFRSVIPAGTAVLISGLISLNDRVLGAMRRAGLLPVILIHDTIPLDMPEVVPEGGRAWFEAALSSAGRHGAALVYNSAQTQADAEAHLARLGSVPPGSVAHLGTIPMRPDPTALPEGLDLTHPYFVVLGTIEPRKNHALLLDVWDRMAAEGGVPLPHLLVLGRRGGRNEHTLRRLDTSPLCGRVIHELPDLPDPTVAALLAGARALLFPSKAEGFGLPAVEAAALGTPVVANSLPVYREILGDYVTSIPVDDPTAWQSAIARLATGERQTKPIPELPTWDQHIAKILVEIDGLPAPVPPTVDRRPSLETHPAPRPIGVSGQAWRRFLRARPSAPHDVLPFAARLVLLPGPVAAVSQTRKALAQQGLADDPDAPWVLMARPGDRPAPGALACIADAVAAHPDATLIFGDTDQAGPFGRCAPDMKPAFDPDLLCSHMRLTGLLGIAAEAFDALGGLEAAAQDAPRHDILLKLSEAHAPESFVHIPEVLTTEPSGRVPEASSGATRAAVADHLRRIGRAAETQPHAAFPEGPVVSLAYARPNPAPRISVLIATRNRPDLLAPCIASLAATDYPDMEILVADNGSDTALTQDLLHLLAGSGRIRLHSAPYPFNHSRLTNELAAQSSGSILVLMNDDVEALDPRWATELAGRLARPDIGIVGARLLYPDGALQHGGVVLGAGNAAEHMPAQLRPGAPGYMGSAVIERRVTAVTGAVLGIERLVYDAVGGLEEEALPTDCNDIDLCLRVGATGRAVLYAPRICFVHHESATRGRAMITPERKARYEAANAMMAARWGADQLADPYYHPCLTRSYPGYALADAARDTSPRRPLAPKRRAP